MKKHKITVFGAGSWGSVLAHVLAENGHQVHLWTRNQDQADEINHQHTNKKYLKDAQLSPDLQVTSDLDQALEASDIYLLVIPTMGIRDLVRTINSKIKSKKLFVHASKGLEQESHKRISTIIKEEIDPNKLEDVVVLSGPSHAEEVIKKDLTTITAASEGVESRKLVQELFMNSYFRVYTNPDVIGVELGGALKNIIALGSGITVGLGYGDNARAALITRGLAEIIRFGLHFGAQESTFMGLSGLGDLIVTGMSTHSRNFKCGYYIGQGMTPEEAVEKVGMVVEGFYTTKAVYEIAQEKNIDMPITNAIYQIITNQVEAKNASLDLMKREGKEEA